MLVVLRVAIGWHFYKEGMKKYRDPGFSSEGFLRGAEGPMAEVYRGMLSDFHDFDAYRDELLTFDDGKSDVRDKLFDEKGKTLQDNPLARWSAQVARDWGEYRLEAESYYGFDEEQKKHSIELLEERIGRMDEAIDAKIDWLRQNPDEVAYYLKVEDEAERQDPPFLESRVAKQKAKLAPITVELPGEVRTTENEFKADLWHLVVNAEQRSKGMIDEPRTQQQKFDRMMIYSHLAIGVCLMIGLFTRLAALGGAFFLASVVASQPIERLWTIGVHQPPAGLDPYYLLIEALALVALATTAAGRWAGVDFFLHKLLTGCCRSKG